jgi:hypothetical protein
MFASRVFPDLSCTNYKVSGLTLRSLIHFELVLVQSDKHRSSFSFPQADNHFSQPHLSQRLSILHRMFFGAFVKSQVGVAAWIHIWVFYSVPLVLMFVSVPVPCRFYCYAL